MNPELTAELKSESAFKAEKGHAIVSLGKEMDYPTYFGEGYRNTIILGNYGTVDWTAGDTAVQTVYETLPLETYITPENIEEMFKDYGDNLTIEIANATLGKWQETKGTDGEPVYIYPGNANIGTTGHKLLIKRVDLTVDGVAKSKYMVTVDGNEEESITKDAVAEALKEAGYGVTTEATYTCRWPQNKEGTACHLDAGEIRSFHIPINFKNTFQIIKEDYVGQYPGSTIEVLYAGRFTAGGLEGNGIVARGWTHKCNREASLSKDIKKGVEVLEGNFKVKAGDVLTRQITLTNVGTGVYENLPIVDEIYGTQYLLVPMVEANAHLADKDLGTHGDFYILNQPGTYENVYVGVDDTGNYMNAATITVAGLGEAHNVGEALSYGGVHTQIKWYFAQTNDVSIHYQTLVPQELQGAYSIGGTTWANDRVGARLYTSMWGGGSVIGHDKDIVLEMGESPEQDVLADYSVVKPGDQVTYRLTLRSEEAGTITLSGVNMADNLPDTFGLFNWEEKGRISGFDVKVTGHRNSYTDNLKTAWQVGDSYAHLESNEEQYILWHDDAVITFEEPGEVYLYYTLTYPGGAGEEELWDQYADKVNGNRVENAFYVYKNPVTVDHELLEIGEVLLQKGVAGTYISTYRVFPGNSRKYYNSQDWYPDRMLLYYVTLYNGDNKRLYLNEMQDKLPKGFTFVHMTPSGNVFTETKNIGQKTCKTIGDTSLGDYPLVDMKIPGVVFRCAIVTGTATEGGVTFTFGAGDGDYAVCYDKERGQYYLNQNEAIVFGYMVRISTKAHTEEFATNTIAMPYSDYLDGGMELIGMDELEVVGGESPNFTDRNDGDRQVMSAQQVQETYGFTAGNEKNWLVSQVTSQWGKIGPGVSKYTESSTSASGGTPVTYTSSVEPSDTVNWRIRIHNTGTGSMTDYTLTDFLPESYEIVGDVKFEIYAQPRNHSAVAIRSMETLCSFSTDPETGKRKISNRDLTLGETIDMGYYSVLVSRDAANRESVSIQFENTWYSIPESGYMDVYLSARNTTGTYVYKVFTNRAVVTPNEQSFDPEAVAYGRVVRNENGNAAGVENTALVTVNAGFSTSSVNTVTGNANTNASAASSDMVRSITLANPEDTFTYILSVTNNTGVPMNKLVLIDSLPQPGDTSPFDTHVKRGSDFTVVLEKETNFVVQVEAENETVTTLNPDQYSLEYSTATDFGGGQSDDWMGENTGKWNASAAEARAIRIIIKDENGTLIPDGATVSVSFDVKAADPEAVEPGQTAWNTFGYHYAIKVHDKTTESQTTESQTTEPKTTELEAMPLEVGVSIPRERKLQKKLVDPEGKPAMISGEESFAFLLYEGEPMSLDFEGDWGTALTDAGRAYKTFAVTIPAGSTESQPVSLNWTWKTGAAYTLVEMPVGDGYRTESLGGSAGNSHRFQYDPKQAVTMECVNVLEHWSIRLTKTDEKDKKLSGAVFALYSPSQADQFSVPAGYGDLEIASAIDRKTAAQETKRWYLAGVAESDKDGVIMWKALLRDSYLLVEVKAPAGYMLSNPEGQPVYRDGLVKELTVVNYSGYELPETGGAGTGVFTIAGSVLSTMAAWGLGKKKRKQTGQD